MGRDEERLEFLKSYEKKLIEEGTKLMKLAEGHWLALSLLVLL